MNKYQFKETVLIIEFLKLLKTTFTTVQYSLITEILMSIHSRVFKAMKLLYIYFQPKIKSCFTINCNIYVTSLIKKVS